MYFDTPKRKKWTLILVGLFLGIGFFSKVVLYDIMSSSQRYHLVNNPIGYRILANWHAVRKIVNVVHIQYWYKESTLPTFHLQLSPSNISKLTDSIPTDDTGLTFGKLIDDEKQYVHAIFSSNIDDALYQEEIKIRIRGLIANNWNATKRAYRLKFPKDAYFQGMRALNLFLPYDRAYFAEPLNAYRAKKLHLFSPEFSFVQLDLNGRSNGVYLAAEPWSKELLARNNTIDSNNIFSNKDIESASTSLFSTLRLADWKSYTADTEEQVFPELQTLFSLLESTDDETFRTLVPIIFDLNKLYSWHIINILAGSNHQTDFSNAVLLFRKETGKFEFVPWDVNLYSPNDFVYDKTNILADRILSEPIFYAEFQKRLIDYTSGNQLEDDLQFFDDLREQYTPAFYADQAKLDTDFKFDRVVSENREQIIANYAAAQQYALRPMFHEEYHPFISTGVFKPTESFDRFLELSQDARSFIQKYPFFTQQDDTHIRLYPGTYFISKTILVPPNLFLTIDPGVTLRFANETSLISYSPIQASGTEKNPIKIVDATPLDTIPWGVFGVINTGNTTNTFSHIEVSGGSSATYNGVFFTSQFSLHNSITHVDTSIFSESHSDDGFHATLGSVEIVESIFANNQADGIDLDFVKNSRISQSSFYNDEPQTTDGDAIDLSGISNTEISEVHIEKYGDKCISVGEQSHIIVTASSLTNCAIGIAVKDRSHADVKHTLIKDNGIGIASYRKKQEFLIPGSINLMNSVLLNNTIQIDAEDTTSVILQDTFQETETTSLPENIQFSFGLRKQ